MSFFAEELLADFARDGERIPDESALWLIDWMAYAVWRAVTKFSNLGGLPFRRVVHQWRRTPPAKRVKD
jgi:hypothetical protein